MSPRVPRLTLRRPKEHTPLDGVDVVLADLDGVVYAGGNAVPWAVESLNAARESGCRVGYITNNASRTDATVADQLTELGLPTQPDEIVTSPQAAMRLLKTMIPDGSLVMVVGGDGLLDELAKAGYAVTRSANDNPAAVVQGFSPDVAWTDLAEAAFALKTPVDEGGIPWVATNTDWTIPRERGIAPGNGTLVSAVHTAIGRLATVAGKPERPIFDVAVARFNADRPLFIGDRLDTDIQGAVTADIDSVLVLTGIDRPKHVLAAPPNQRPTYIVSDLRELSQVYPAVFISEDKNGGTLTQVGDAVVRITDGPDVEIVAKGKSQINLLRAGSQAIWNSGRAIYGFNVPGELFADPFHRP